MNEARRQEKRRLLNVHWAVKYTFAEYVWGLQIGKTASAEYVLGIQIGAAGYALGLQIGWNFEHK